ncbi:hypothetical protein B4U80_14040 [Leptotrombidium deliense]|uniref:Serpin domain-containing protein n=1 Tax=Leptotrombidium deliense TaxID=299467 RepID=A0A443S4H0_9ACAR|nr:hypothetical protein B4U80_14040 [Leptotrombidium deliense]
MRFLILLFVVNVIADPVPEKEFTDSNFATGLNAFSLDFMKQMEFREKNVLFSPLGLSMAVGMILEAANNTHADGFKLLHFSDIANGQMMHMKFKENTKK